MQGAVLRFLTAWKWVLGYVALLYLSLSFTRRFADWLELRNLQGLLGVCILAALMAWLTVFLSRIRKIRGRLHGPTVLRFLGLFAVFVYAMVRLTSLTIERIHFLQYGILAGLCLQAAGRHHAGFRRFGYAAVAAILIGFLDEVLQGFLPTRYYDDHDLLLNVVAACLVLLTFAVVPGPAGAPPARAGARSGLLSTSRSETGAFRIRPADFVAVLIIPSLVISMRWIHVVTWDEPLLPGIWERQNACGLRERVEIGPSNSILWRDESGGEARGTFRVLGNRLDGPMLRVEVIEGDQEGPCAWKAGQTRDRHFELCLLRLLFRLEPNHPFVRTGQS